MTEREAAKYLVQLHSDYERMSAKLLYSTDIKYSEAVAMAIMALKPKEEFK